MALCSPSQEVNDDTTTTTTALCSPPQEVYGNPKRHHIHGRRLIFTLYTAPLWNVGQEEEEEKSSKKHPGDNETERR